MIFDAEHGADSVYPIGGCTAPDCGGEGDDDDEELGETASREECIDACDEAGYEAVAWDTISTACYCFMEEWCDCVEEYDAENADDWCGCVEKDGFEPEDMSESECAAAGCEYESGSG